MNQLRSLGTRFSSLICAFWCDWQLNVRSLVTLDYTSAYVSDSDLTHVVIARYHEIIRSDGAHCATGSDKNLSSPLISGICLRGCGTPSIGNSIPGVASLLQVSKSSRWNDDVLPLLFRPRLATCSRSCMLAMVGVCVSFWSI
jgi:hypothetical protein